MVEFLIKTRSRKYEIKKQVIGKDPDSEKSRRIWNCVIEWDRDGITIEADERHVREILKGFELERAHHSTLRLHAPWKGRMRAAREGMTASGITDVDSDRPKSSTSGKT